MSEKNKNKIKISEVRDLYEELVEINKNLKPPAPDPAVWPPIGWAVHQADETLLYQVVDAEVLRADLFGSPEKDLWIKEAKQRVAQIEKILIGYFYPEPKEEGTQRKVKLGFVCMLKTGIKRVVESEIVEEILEKCGGKAKDVINWEAKLDLREYRKLEPEIQEIFNSCLVEEPTKPSFEITQIEN